MWTGVREEMGASFAHNATGRSLLILKTARTGSTWLCDLLNQRGMHVTQEALLNWERDCPHFSDNCEEYFTKEGRLGWVTQSLLRPMPKTPYAIDGSCAKLAKQSKHTKSVELASEDLGDKVKETACAVKAQCRPPYTHESCNDVAGCFNQRVSQKGCYNVEMRQPSITGISFNFQSSLGDAKNAACLSEPSCASKQAAMLREATEAVEKTGIEVLTLAQVRSNLLRWGVSRMYHSGSSNAVKYNKDGKITVKDLENMLKGPVSRVEPLLQMAGEVSENAQIIFYEDIARSPDKSTEAIAKAYQMSKTEAKETGTDVSPSANEQNQHPGGLEEYIENLDEIREQTQKSQPCVFRMTQTSKDDTLILPLVKRDGQVKIDLSRDCCVADRNVYLRSVADYVKAGLEC
eukprot:CAMPEP_0184478300 /NCGR_PEP_ID=MMETSP0113_2-20130426/359_1 /TAXON_ID=91329 /ORGANISM="Norrisiella sphaerica, Strain BC52" /LENGTH=404 /DNA_ID=CAMNT_0026856041 /DNA_START=162 /DNA_END=1376 /DNA_ORIENTATION=+